LLPSAHNSELKMRYQKRVAASGLKSSPMNFLGAASELFHTQNPRVLLEGPARTGKTTAAIVRTAQLCLKHPRSRHLWVRKTRRSMTQSVLQIWEEIAQPRCWVSDMRQRDGRSSYNMPGGSKIVIAGSDDPSRIMSAEFDTITAFEATELSANDYEMLVTRLSGDAMGWNQILLDCNPGTPGHWLNQRANAGELMRLKSRLEDNPVMFADGKWTPRGERYRSEVLARLTGVRRQRLLDGIWSAAEGLVYAQLPDCVVATPPDSRVPSPSIKVFGGIDWGWTDPTCITIGVLSQDGVLRIVEEIYESRMHFDELARRAGEITEKWQVERYF
jgi:Phage terminase large subunit